MVLLEFSLTEFFRPHYCPGVDLASNRNKYQEYFLGGKGGRYLGMTTLPPSWPTVSKSGSLNLLEPSGRVIGLYRYRFTFTFITLSLMRRSQWRRSLAFHAKCLSVIMDSTPIPSFYSFVNMRCTGLPPWSDFHVMLVGPSPPVIFSRHPIVGSEMKLMLPSADKNHCFTHLKSLMIMWPTRGDIRNIRPTVLLQVVNFQEEQLHS
jgi:hypothetical protein